MRFDCHQHLWPPALVTALRERDAMPFLRDWTLYLEGENPYRVDPAAHDVERRSAAEHADRVLVSLSSPLGIEHAPDGAELIDIWHASALELPDPFHVWAAASVAAPDAAALTRVLREDRVAGLQLPATALDGPDALGHVAPLLEVLERSGKPLLVHPGPAPAESGELPDWWPALVPYVAQMHRSWMAWHVAGRRRHPALRIAFVALAGLAPLHHERLAARGGPVFAPDPNVFYETSSYHSDAIAALARVVGPAAVVHGSDRPYAEPLDPLAFHGGYFTANPSRLLQGPSLGTDHT
ncbi:amidohydrolase [Actinoplanes sp. CA-252034]|uniref:amidohydrolase n=1 Tax=Actinoplanes sp. CA-252034 TaxID=3239906 RepID=UPI003D99E592